MVSMFSINYLFLRRFYVSFFIFDVSWRIKNVGAPSLMETPTSAVGVGFTFKSRTSALLSILSHYKGTTIFRNNVILPADCITICLFCYLCMTK